jgi:hypothetical protein
MRSFILFSAEQVAQTITPATKGIAKWLKIER